MNAQPSLITSFSMANPYNSNSMHNGRLVQITREDALPFNLVDSNSSKSYIYMDPRYDLPTRTALSRKLRSNMHQTIEQSVINH
jgi:site-specific DNA-adenine methylase